MSAPNTLQAAGFVGLIAAIVFKLQHWPFAGVLFLLAPTLMLLALIIRLVKGKLELGPLSRDVGRFGLVAWITLRMLHWPGNRVALFVLVLGAIGVIIYDRENIFPNNWNRISNAGLFVAAVTLVVIGAVFRIQHWPGSSALLIAALVMTGVYFALYTFREREQ